MNKYIKWILIILIILFILGLALYPKIKKNQLSSDSKSEKRQTSQSGAGQQRRPLNIDVKIIKPEELIDKFQTTGNLMPDEEVSLLFETSGKITNIYFSEGSTVKKGDLLAKVNDAPLQAELKKLEAQVPLATDRVFRQKSLLEKDAVSQEAYEQVSTELETLNADIESVKSRINQTELRTPFDGIIGLRQVSEGAFASPTTVIATLTKIIPLKLEFSINEIQANFVKKGTNLDFRISGDLNVYTASVYAVEPQVDLSTRTMRARAIYANPGGRLKPGRTASIEIKLNEIKNALSVPSEAMIAEMGRDIAFLYKNGSAHQIILKKGLRNEASVQIVDGIQAGDTLIVTGVMQLRDDMPVKIDHIIQ
ncbi:MAG: efflux RND transporter periplasmic adaptor subunit [Candidatus Azobacteroides sp.]|nr:efflux RND transporter periplasmic adaptor subunit [Candidatus Azobacteroides sp.]